MGYVPIMVGVRDGWFIEWRLTPKLFDNVDGRGISEVVDWRSVVPVCLGRGIDMPKLSNNSWLKRTGCCELRLCDSDVWWNNDSWWYLREFDESSKGFWTIIVLENE